MVVSIIWSVYWVVSVLLKQISRYEGVHDLGGAYSHIKAFGCSPFPHQRKVCIEVCWGEHLACIGHKTWPVGCIDLLCFMVTKFLHRVLWDEFPGSVSSDKLEIWQASAGKIRNSQVTAFTMTENVYSHWYTSTHVFRICTTTFMTYFLLLSVKHACL